MVLILTFFASLAAGILTGCATALFEISFLFFTTSKNALSFFFPAVGFYAVFWSLTALLLGAAVLFILLVLRKSASFSGVLRLELALLLPLALFMILGGHVNRLYLPSYSDPKSLAFNGIFLAVCLGLGFLIYRGAEGFFNLIRRSPAWFKWGIGGLFLAAIAVKILLPSGEEKSIEPMPVSTSGPNILWLTLDALRPDHMSYFGYSRKTTPHIDELAKNAVVFTQGYANSSWTRASVASMLTSLYPSTHGVNGLATGLSPSLTTLPELLHAQGYATGIFSANAFVSPTFGYHQGLDRFHYKKVSMYNELILGHVLRSLRKYGKWIKRLDHFMEYYELPWMKSGAYSTRDEGLKDAFLDWTRTIGGRPFFAYFHFMESHTPYENEPPFDRMFDPEYPGKLKKGPPIFEPFWPFFKGEPLPEPELKNLIAQYDGGIADIDQTLSEIFQALQEAGLFEKTVIIITADHGDEFYDHEGWGHGKSLFNEVIHVPFILYGPSFLGPAWQVTAKANHVDLMPTILELAGVSIPGSAEGKSLLPVIKGQAAATEERVYSEVIHENSFARSLIEGDLKLIEIHVHDKETWLLYDLKNDPLEKSPLDLAARPAEAARLKELLADYAKRAAEKAVKPETAEVDQEMKERLKTLGYVQ